ncbi:DUF7935 family protein [Aquimarina rhabdastrellae]
MDITLVQLLLALLPAILVGVIAFYFFNLHTKNEEQRRRYLLHRETQKQTIPLRLQAYERMALFLERINPGKLLLRISPVGTDKNSYESLLTNTIEQEFEHNLTQQIYISDECWNAIRLAKNTTIAIIRKAAKDDAVTDANGLREVVLKQLVEKSAPTDAALAFVKKDVGELF